jgi:hypothetical protein
MSDGKKTRENSEVVVTGIASPELLAAIDRESRMRSFHLANKAAELAILMYNAGKTKEQILSRISDILDPNREFHTNKYVASVSIVKGASK